MAVVGQSVPRGDAVEKVTGAARYVDDIVLPDMWYGAVVRTTIPHGRLKGVTLDPAFDWSRVVTADASDIPGKNCVAMIEEDLPLIVTDRFRHIGEAVLLIAAPTRALAREAARFVHVDCEELEPIFTLEDSKRAKVLLHGDNNVVAEYTITKGEAAAGFAEADEIVEGRYAVGAQEHAYIETQGMIAAPREGGGVSVIGSMQCPYYVSRAMSVLLGMPEEALSIRQAVVGGAFGGKEDYPSVLAGYCAILARKANRPVKIVYERDEDIAYSTKRHPAWMRYRTGVRSDGTLTAMEIRIEMDAGAYITLTPVVLSRAIIHSPGPYRCEHVDAHAIAYATNVAPHGAFRGFGAPQVTFALESHIDEVARRIGMSPLAFRTHNALRKGDTTATGQRLTESVGSEVVLTAAAERSDFARKLTDLAREEGDVRRGIGMSFFLHGAGFTGSGEAKLKGEAGLRLDADGRIAILTACTEMGQGAHTVLPQMAADFLGVDLDCIAIETPDTALVPNSGPTVASRTTMIMGSVLQKCAASLTEKLLAFAAELYALPREKLALQGRALRSSKRDVATVAELVQAYRAERGELTVIEAYALPPDIRWDEETYTGDAYPVYAWGCDVAEVEVDLETFEVRVVKMWLAQDIGCAINPVMAEGQIEGGTLQACGYATIERVVNEAGRFVTDRFQTYIIPTALDAPEMETIIVEEPYSFGPKGAKGVGELPMDGGAPAIANAIAHATGLRVAELPITPERIYEVWRSKRTKG